MWVTHDNINMSVKLKERFSKKNRCCGELIHVSRSTKYFCLLMGRNLLVVEFRWLHFQDKYLFFLVDDAKYRGILRENDMSSTIPDMCAILVDLEMSKEKGGMAF